MIPSFWRDTIAILRAPLVTDEYGTPGTERDWAHPTTTTVATCSVQPLASSEYELGREAVTVRWRIYAPRGTDIRAGDRVTFDGETYEADGDGQEWPSPSGELDHVEALMKRREG